MGLTGDLGDSAKPVSDTAKPSVLVVDDEELLRASLGQALDRAGYTAITARNGGEALAILEREFVPILLLDIFMPERDGLETLLTARRISPKTRVAVMSGHCGHFDYLEAGLKLGADEAVRKPILPSELISVMRRLKPVAAGHDDRRRASRVSTRLDGQIFDPLTWKSLPCRVLNLSEGGALVECAGHEEFASEIVLHVAHFGRFEARVAHRSTSLAGLSFKAGEAGRNRLKDMLKAYAERGAVAAPAIRKHPRIRADGKVSVQFLPAGENLCDVLDISPEGVSLKTDVRPPLGDIVRVGEIRGRVTRHHAQGIALLFEP